jgi:hypothetical protein
MSSEVETSLTGHSAWITTMRDSSTPLGMRELFNRANHLGTKSGGGGTIMILRDGKASIH